MQILIRLGCGCKTLLLGCQVQDLYLKSITLSLPLPSARHHRAPSGVEQGAWSEYTVHCAFQSDPSNVNEQLKAYDIETIGWNFEVPSIGRVLEAKTLSLVLILVQVQIQATRF